MVNRDLFFKSYSFIYSAHDSVGREVFYNIPIEFGTPMQQVRLKKVRLNETYSTVRVGRHLSDLYPIKSGLK